MLLEEDGGSEGMVIVVGMFVGGRELGCGEGEIVFRVTLVLEGRGLVLRCWDFGAATLGGIGISDGGSGLSLRRQSPKAAMPILGLEGSDWALRCWGWIVKKVKCEIQEPQRLQDLTLKMVCSRSGVSWMPNIMV